MPDWLTPDFLNGLGVSGVCLLVVISLTVDKGPLRTKREFTAVEQRAKFAEARNVEQSQQISTLTAELKTMNAFMAGVKQAAEDKP